MPQKWNRSSTNYFLNVVERLLKFITDLSAATSHRYLLLPSVIIYYCCFFGRKDSAIPQSALIIDLIFTFS